MLSAAPLVSPYQRILLAFGAVLSTLVLACSLFVVHDAYSPFRGDLRWSEPSGEPQVIGWILFVGGFFVLASYLLFSVPLVLLWPVRLQLRHWYGPLLVTLLWPPFADIVLLHQPITVVLQEFARGEHTMLFAELFAAVACGLYLLLLHGAARSRPAPC